MVDTPSNLDPAPAQPADAERPESFFASTTGKLVIGAVALILVVAIVGTIAWVFLINSASPTPTTAANTNLTGSPAAVATSSTPSPADTAPIVDPQEKPLGSTFTFRNIFAPTVQEQIPPTVAASSTSSASSSSSSSSTAGTTVKVPADTLYLQSIQTVNGSTTATFIWNGATYTLKEGGTIPDSPWKVLSIGNSSVVMLFGDTQVTLSAGQGLTK